MKSNIKFILFYSLGTFLTVFVIALIISALLGILNSIIPLEELSEGEEAFVTLFFIFVPILAGGALWGIYFVKPVITIIALFRCLSAEQNDLNQQITRILNRRNHVKLRYLLYHELLADLYILSENLKDADLQRKELEARKKNWITGISHDLKTPLSYITGYADLLLNRDYQFQQEERLQFLTYIRDKGLLIGELIEDLNLSFKMEEYSGSLPLNRTRFDFIDFMQRLIADIINDPRAGGYEFTLLCDIPRFEIFADYRLLQRAFQNIIINSVIHNPQGTHIETSIKITQPNQVIVDIEDNGCGMDEEMLLKIFNRYYRYSKKDSANFGGGLGLGVAKNILDAHEGSITVASKPSQGTTFTIQLLI